MDVLAAPRNVGMLCVARTLRLNLLPASTQACVATHDIPHLAQEGTGMLTCSSLAS